MLRLLTILICLLSTAHADERPIRERVTDGLGFGLMTGGLTLAGGLVGAVAGAALVDSGDDWLGPLETGVGVGGLAGFVGGALLFDEDSDGDGSLLGAAGGAAIGLGVAALIEERKRYWRSGLPLAVLGAAIGYAVIDAPQTRGTAARPQMLRLGGSF